MRSSLVSLLALSFWAASLLSLSHAATLSGQASGQRKRDRIALSVGADGTLTEEGGVDRGEVFVEVSSRQQHEPGSIQLAPDAPLHTSLEISHKTGGHRLLLTPHVECKPMESASKEFEQIPAIAATVAKNGKTLNIVNLGACETGVEGAPKMSWMPLATNPWIAETGRVDVGNGEHANIWKRVPLTGGYDASSRPLVFASVRTVVPTSNETDSLLNDEQKAQTKALTEQGTFAHSLVLEDTPQRNEEFSLRLLRLDSAEAWPLTNQVFVDWMAFPKGFQMPLSQTGTTQISYTATGKGLCSLKVRFNEMFQPQCSLPKVLVSVWAIVHGKTRADEENSFPPTLGPVFVANVGTVTQCGFDLHLTRVARAPEGTVSAAEDAKNFENAYIVENNTGENIDIKIDWIAIEDPSPSGSSVCSTTDIHQGLWDRFTQSANCVDYVPDTSKACHVVEPATL